MDYFLMEMDANNRYKDLRRRADQFRLIRRVTARGRAHRIAIWRNRVALIRSFIAGRLRLKPQV